MTHFVIHVGPHKTGTTYLQEAFVTNRAALMGRMIHYPDVWGPRAHYDLIHHLQNGPSDKLESYFQELHSARHEIVLISAEGLLDLPEPSVAYLNKLVGQASTEIVFYARSWGEVLPSIWREIVKEGSTSQFSEFACERLVNPWTTSTMNFARGLDVYSQYFGHSSIRIASYNQIIEEDLDLFRHFAASFLDWPDAPIPPFGSINVSLGTTDSETLRVLNCLEMSIGGQPSTTYSLLLTNAYLRLKDHLGLENVWARQKNYIRQFQIDETAPGLRSLHRDLFSLYGSSMISPKAQRLFFVPRVVGTSYIASDYLLHSGAVPDIVRAYQRIKADLLVRQG